MAKFIIIYSTVDNCTKNICLKIQDIIEKGDNFVDLVSIDEDQLLNLENFDKIIIGASIRYGKHSKKIYKFIRENQSTLDNKVNAFFSVNLVARKSQKNRPDTNPYLIKFLDHIAWKPQHLAVFGGKLDYQRYGILDRQMIRFIMWLTKGPTDPKSVIEYTNWDDVNSFANLVCEI